MVRYEFDPARDCPKCRYAAHCLSLGIFEIFENFAPCRECGTMLLGTTRAAGIVDRVWLGHLGFRVAKSRPKCISAAVWKERIETKYISAPTQRCPVCQAAATRMKEILLAQAKQKKQEVQETKAWRREAKRRALREQREKDENPASRGSVGDR